MIMALRTPGGGAEPVAGLQERRVLLADADYRRLEETRAEVGRRLSIASDEPQLHSVRVDRLPQLQPR